MPPVAHVHEPDIEPDHGAEEKQEVDLGPGVNVQQELLAEIKAMRVSPPVTVKILTNRNKWLQWKRT